MKVESFFEGLVVRQMYRLVTKGGFMQDTKYAVEMYLDELSEECICSSSLSKPILKVGESIFIENIGKRAVVTKVTRATDNSVTYQTNHILDKIIDEKSLLSMEEAYLELDEKREERYQEAQGEIRDLANQLHAKNKTLDMWLSEYNKTMNDKQPKKWW